MVRLHVPDIASGCLISTKPSQCILLLPTNRRKPSVSQLGRGLQFGEGLIHYCTTWAEENIQVAIMRARAVTHRLSLHTEGHRQQWTLLTKDFSCKVV